MGTMVGTVITIKELYGIKSADIQFRNGTNSTPLITLEENRKYIVPYFQREIRWTKDNLITLINDVRKGSKFLGNLIFTKRQSDYEILDGQQRTTVIALIVLFLKSKYSERFDIFETCEITVESFPGFRNLCNHFFDLEKIPESEMEEIIGSDCYGQRDKYMEIWDAMEKVDLFANIAEAEDFLKNLEQSQLNVIIETDSAERSIEAFLDVNLKGVRLDAEDIFKGYLFAQDNSEELFKIWSKLKQENKVLNTYIDYPFMMLLEHFLQCELSKHESYRLIEFSTDFTLKNEKEIEGNKYSSGEHIIKIIHNKKYIREELIVLDKIQELLVSIVTETHAPAEIREYYKKLADADKKFKVDNDEIDIMYNLLRKVVLDKNKAPNCLIIKYLLESFTNLEFRKDNFDSIYGVFVTSTLFTLYETKKNSDGLYKIIRSDDWEGQMINYAITCFEGRELTSRQISAGYQFVLTKSQSISQEKQEFRCKSIATIYEYFDIDNNGIRIKPHKTKELEQFLNNSEKYSVEHFIINDSGKCECKLSTNATFEYEYPEEIKKYKNSLFNYVFIDRKTNGNIKNLYLLEKVEVLANPDKNIKGYSEKVIQLVSDKLNLPDPKEFDSEEEAKGELDRYFQMNFRNQYAQFAASVIEMISKGE